MVPPPRENYAAPQLTAHSLLPLGSNTINMVNKTGTSCEPASELSLAYLMELIDANGDGNFTKEEWQAQGFGALTDSSPEFPLYSTGCYLCMTVSPYCSYACGAQFHTEQCKACWGESNLEKCLHCWEDPSGRLGFSERRLRASPSSI